MHEQYKIETRTKNNTFYLALKSATFAIIGFSIFCDRNTGGIFGLLIGIIGLIIGVVSLISLITCFIDNKYDVYVIKCPYCEQTVDFPVDEDGWNCPCCEKRMVKVDGIIKKTEN